MIVDMPDTTTTELSKRLIATRSEVGAMALSRVLTLVIVVSDVDAEEAIGVANAASRQHPCRIVVLVHGPARGRSRIDGQIRVGGDAGASEVVVCRLMGELTKHASSVVVPLLLPDSPIVAWWPRQAPKETAADPIGAMAQRRITDAVHLSGTPREALRRLAEGYAPGDTDLSWGRITRWRGLLAAALDQAPFEPVQSAVVLGAPDSPSADLLAAWLHARLKCPVRVKRSTASSGVIGVQLTRASGVLDLHRPVEGNIATLTTPDQPVRTIALAHRSDAECLAEELRRLDPDEIYEQALTRGLAGLGPQRGD